MFEVLYDILEEEDKIKSEPFTFVQILPNKFIFANKPVVINPYKYANYCSLNAIQFILSWKYLKHYITEEIYDKKKFVNFNYTEAKHINDYKQVDRICIANETIYIACEYYTNTLLIVIRGLFYNVQLKQNVMSEFDLQFKKQKKNINICHVYLTNTQINYILHKSNIIYTNFYHFEMIGILDAIHFLTILKHNKNTKILNSYCCKIGILLLLINSENIYIAVYNKQRVIYYKQTHINLKCKNQYINYLDDHFWNQMLINNII